jgi:hypothetical protein
MNASSMTEDKEHYSPLTYANHKLHPDQEWKKCLTYHDFFAQKEPLRMGSINDPSAASVVGTSGGGVTEIFDVSRLLLQKNKHSRMGSIIEPISGVSCGKDHQYAWATIYPKPMHSLAAKPTTTRDRHGSLL